MADRLLVVGFATAHVTGLAVVGLLYLHYQSTLGGFLEPIGTSIGVFLFGVLWGVAIVTHHFGFRTIAPWAIADRRSLLRFLGTGFAWGALTGGGTFWVLAIVGTIGLFVSDPAAVVDLFSLTTLLLALIGTAFSLVIGGIVGLIAAICDSVIGGVVDRAVEL